MDLDFTVKAAPVLRAKSREIHVLVIGESVRFRALQINGAKVENTPRLMRQKNLVSFQEAVAPACMTGLCVPALITPVTAENINEAASMPSVSAVFRKAGYSTWWLSSQRKHGVIDTRCSIYARDAEHSRFVSSKLTAQFQDYRTAHDGDLLPHLDEALASEHERIFIVLHTMGSHSLYMDRYPQAFEKFPVDTSLCVEETMKGIIPMPLMIIDTAEARQQLTNAYNNTIGYTDWLLGEVIGRLEQQTGAIATLTYVSDHGENDADAPILPFCHGVISPDTIRVPMLIWTSPAYGQERPERVAALNRHVRTPFCADTTFHTVIDLAGLECSLLDKTQSVAHPGFAPKPRRLVDLNCTTVLDFDRQILSMENGRQGWHRLSAGAGRD
jgi:glucan phosphoethanolaminetransferase (alkaline phosphatase superfamily)